MGSKVDVKVVLLGKEYSGKTSLVERYLHHRFNESVPYQNVSKMKSVFTHLKTQCTNIRNTTLHLNDALTSCLYRLFWNARVDLIV